MNVGNKVPTSRYELIRGGRIATQRILYQHLYALRLMAETLDGRCDGFEKEPAEDFQSWGSQPQEGGPYRRLIEVKTRESGCFLRGRSTGRGGTREAFVTLAQRIRKIPIEETGQPGNRVLVGCRLVYNKIRGHDCDAEGCRSKVSSFPEYKALEQAISDRNHGSDLKNALELETFLPLNFSRGDILAELAFLKEEYQPILDGLGQIETADFVRAIFGLTVPYFEKIEQRRVEDIGESNLSLSQIVHRQADTASLLRSALETTLTRAHSLEERQRQDLRIRSAQAQADTLLREARPRRWSSATDPSHEVPLPERHDARQALTILSVLSTISLPPVFPTLKDITPFLRDNGNFVLRTGDRPTDAFPLHAYLQYHRPSHYDRVHLILSFASFLYTLSEQGIGLTAFRSDQREYRDWYFIRDTDRGPQFLMGDHGVLRLFDSRTGLLDPRWIEGKVAATAIRSLYYGANDPRRIHRSTIFRSPWNDNVVLDVAEWLERKKPLIGVADLKRELELVFEDETKHWPIVCESVDPKFIEDVVTVGDDSVVRLLSASEARPVALLKDHSRWYESVHYALWAQAQIGMILSSEGAVNLVNYTPYSTVRWARSRERDRAIAATMRPGNLPDSLAGRKSATERQQIVFTGMCDPEHIRDVVANVFGLPYETYVRWLKNQFSQAQRLVRIPKALQVDLELAHRKRDRLRRLEAPWIPYQRVSESGPPATGDPDVATFLVDSDALNNVLANAQYEPADCKGLGISDSLDGRLGNVVDMKTIAGNTATNIRVRVRRDPREMPEQGLLRITDAGLDASIKGDEAVIRELEFALQAGVAVGERAVGRAWRLLQSILGREAEGQVSTDDRDQVIGRAESTSGWLIVTGAAGTGKTRYVAGQVASFLDTPERIAFPPPRALVVAATHYALDNFVQEFKDVTHGRIVPYRYVSRSRSDALLDERRVDPAVLQESRTHYKQELQVALGDRYSGWLRTDGEKEMTDRTGVHDLERRLASAKQGIQFPTVPVPPEVAMIPSHERFRYTRLDYLRRWPAGELDGLVFSLKQRLETGETAPTDLGVNHETSDSVPSEPHSLLAERDECFAAPLVATTLDGLDRLPDIPYDLVVFEEASQIRPLKVLKTLSKILRANGAGPCPQVIFSGDPAQLAPYDEPEVNHRGDVETRYLEMRSILDLVEEAAIQHLTLTTQQRMHPAISNLVSALFYPGQRWSLAREELPTGGVWWIDTSTLPAREKAEDGGRSWRRRAETVIAQKLVNWLRKVGVRKVLVVSPYMAQTDDLRFLLDDQTSIRTVDGCQGRTAEAVVVSLVGATPFAFESRRLNVAMSRARDYLFLVGDLQPLLYDRSFDTSPHVARLAEFFGPEGQYRARVKPVVTIENWEFRL